MPWFKVDDGFHGHPKVVDLSLEAIGLWTVAGSWCAKYLTDGHVPSRTVARLGGTDAMADELRRAELWDPADGGWMFRDWLDYQPSKVEVEAERDAARERMKKVRAAKKGVRGGSGEQPANVRQNIGRSSEEVRLAPSQSQSHPYPDQEELSSEDAEAPIRPEISRLLDILDEEIELNGGKKPSRTKRNIDAVRLMLDRDGHTPDQIEKAMRWAQRDEFWRANILSASKLREKYDQLRLSAQRRSGTSRAHDRQNNNLSVVQQLAALDAQEQGAIES